MSDGERHQGGGPLQRSLLIDTEIPRGGDVHGRQQQEPGSDEPESRWETSQRRQRAQSGADHVQHPGGAAAGRVREAIGPEHRGVEIVGHALGLGDLLWNLDAVHQRSWTWT